VSVHRQMADFCEHAGPPWVTTLSSKLPEWCLSMILNLVQVGCLI
jgi:hypothetical protein